MANNTATITSIYRYPVKGLTGQSLDTIPITTGETIPFDRAFAIENGDSGFDQDQDQPKHLPKQRFLMLMRNEELAKLSCNFIEDSLTLEISEGSEQIVTASLNSIEGKRAVEIALEKRLKNELKGPLQILHKPGFSFSDVAKKVVHLVNLNTLRELENKIGQAINPLRFRANIYVDGLAAWEEFNWIDRIVGNSEIELTGIDRTVRCAATEVDPETGARNLNLPQQLFKHYNHADCGIYLEVTKGGILASGSQIEVIR